MKLPAIDTVVDLLRHSSTPVSPSYIAQKFNNLDRVEIFAYLKRLCDLGHIQRVVYKERIHYAMPPDASGLIAVYARPLPAFDRSRVVVVV